MSYQPSISDKELLLKIASGDYNAFDKLYKRYNRLFLTWVQSRIPEADATKDIVQEFWMKLWQNADTYKSDKTGSAKRYLLKSLSYYTTDFLRKSLTLKEEMDEKQWVFLNDTSGYTHVSEMLEEEELRQLITDTLASLPELTRIVFNLRNEGHTIKETAELANLSEKTVKIHYKDAKDALKERVLETYSTVNGKPAMNEKLLLLLFLLESDLFF